MQPIQLTKFGETLINYPGSESNDQSELYCCIGIHEECGWMDIHKISKTHVALTCRNCGLRVVIPKDIKTYGQLREYCNKIISNMEK